MKNQHFDLVVVGSGFGSLFFVEGFVRKNPRARILILEWGSHNSLAWQLETGRNSPIDPKTTFKTDAHGKQWNFTIGLGGGTNCWYAQTPRFHPNDFLMRTQYGVAQDWPLTYDELEPYYLEAETVMQVAGSDKMTAIMPRSAPFPLPPHRLTAVDRIMEAAQPEAHFPIATARASRPLATRAACCSAARCHICPTNAKFTFENGFSHLLKAANVEIRQHCEVTHLEHRGAVVESAIYRQQGKEMKATGDLFVLGANAIHSPAILLRSGLHHPLTGLGLHEQVGYSLEVFLDGLDNLDGGTITTGLNFSLYDGPFRANHGGALIFFENRWPHGLRKEFQRWRQIAPLTVVIEDLPSDANRVILEDDIPVVHHASHSSYAERGIAESLQNIERVLAPLPVERIDFKGRRDTESHIQGTLRMGTSTQNSVIDRTQIHHRYRNLVIVGSAIFPSGSICNPSLTVAALSLRSADLIS